MATLRERRTDVVTRRLGIVTYWHTAVINAHVDGDGQLLAERMVCYREAVQRLNEALERLKALPPPKRRHHRRPNRRGNSA